MLKMTKPTVLTKRGLQRTVNTLFSRLNFFSVCLFVHLFVGGRGVVLDCGATLLPKKTEFIAMRSMLETIV